MFVIQKGTTIYNTKSFTYVRFSVDHLLARGSHMLCNLNV